MWALTVMPVPQATKFPEESQAVPFQADEDGKVL